MAVGLIARFHNRLTKTVIDINGAPENVGDKDGDSLGALVDVGSVYVRPLGDPDTDKLSLEYEEGVSETVGRPEGPEEGAIE